MDRHQGLAELGRVVAGDHGELRGRGEEEVERDQALAGGGRGLLQDEVDGLEGRPGEVVEVGPAGQGGEAGRAVAAIALPEGVALS